MELKFSVLYGGGEENGVDDGLGDVAPEAVEVGGSVWLASIYAGGMQARGSARGTAQCPVSDEPHSACS